MLVHDLALLQTHPHAPHPYVHPLFRAMFFFAGACPTQMSFLRGMVCPKPAVGHPNPMHMACPVVTADYWEADVLGTVRYPEAVKFMTASFADNFGAVRGDQLRDLCERHGYVVCCARINRGVVVAVHVLLFCRRVFNLFF